MESSHAAAAAAAAANPPASKKTSRTALSCAPPGSASAAIAARHGCAAAVRPPWFDDRVYPPAGPDSRPGATEAETARKARRRQPHMHTCTPARPSLLGCVVVVVLPKPAGSSPAMSILPRLRLSTAAARPLQLGGGRRSPSVFPEGCLDVGVMSFVCFLQ